VKLASEPDKADRSLSLWTCGQLAIKLTDDGTVEPISAQSVQRIVDSSKLVRSRVDSRLSPKDARDEGFRAPVPSRGCTRVTSSPRSGLGLSEHAQECSGD